MNPKIISYYNTVRKFNSLLSINSDNIKNNFNLFFGVPRFDICQICDRLENLIDSETTPETKRFLEI